MRGPIVSGKVYMKNGKCYTNRMKDDNIERLKDEFEKLEIHPSGKGVMLSGVTRRATKPKYITAKL